VLREVAERLGNAVEDVPELNRVRVMTMHGAKGLSARVVFIPGLEHGVLPNAHQAPYPAQLLEAARLLYVSITRARASVRSLIRATTDDFRHLSEPNRIGVRRSHRRAICESKRRARGE
jgi:superfamily I DNA/RNA helicase